MRFTLSTNEEYVHGAVAAMMKSLAKSPPQFYYVAKEDFMASDLEELEATLRSGAVTFIVGYADAAKRTRDLIDRLALDANIRVIIAT